MKAEEISRILSETPLNSFKMVPMPAVRRLIQKSVREKADFSDFRFGQDTMADLVYLGFRLTEAPDLSEQFKALNAVSGRLRTWYMVDFVLPYLKKPFNHDLIMLESARLLETGNPFARRLGYVIMLKLDLKDSESARQIFSRLRNDTEKTVRMAEGWLISEICIRSPALGQSLIGKSELSYDILSIGISKTLDSFRVSEQDKESFRKLRRRLRGKEAGE